MPSPQNASYTPPTTTPFSSPTDHSRLHRGMTTSPCPRLSRHSPAFASLLMLPGVLHTSHATISYHFGVSRTLSMLMRFYYRIRMDISTRWWLYHCVECQVLKTSHQTIIWPTLSIPLPNGADILVSVDSSTLYPPHPGATITYSFSPTASAAAPTCTPLLSLNSPHLARPTF